MKLTPVPLPGDSDGAPQCLDDLLLVGVILSEPGKKMFSKFFYF
jgi:hypothetical protein